MDKSEHCRIKVRSFKKSFEKKVVKMFVNFLSMCVFVAIAGYIFTLERGDLQKYGPFQNALNSRIIKCYQDRNLHLDVSGIVIHFFDFKNNINKTFPINDAAKGILNIKNLDKTKKFIMFVGGFTSHINHDVEKQMREAYKTQTNSYLIIPDHSAYTNSHQGNIGGYERAVTHVHYIGKALGEMWADISLNGVSANNIEFVGHSLGGQILGHVGTTFQGITSKLVSRVSALDPAGPCFVQSAAEEQVRSGVARYVEVYHCNAGALGSSNILGDVDFIINKNGETQPHCRNPMIPVMIASSKAASCAHRICVDLWTASVKHPNLLTAYSCESYENFKEGKCLSNDKTVAGFANPGKAKGLYFLSTAMYNLKLLM